MDTDELLTTTRSVRRRLDLDRPVNLAVVRDCLRVALQAPNGGNRQDWRWLVVADAGLRADVAAVYRRAFDARYPAATGCADRQVAAARHLAENLHRVPVLVIACLRLRTAALPPGNQAGLWGSLLPAAWSYMLAARARGLGTAWTAVHLDAEEEMGRLLGLPAAVRQGALIPTAHLAGGPLRPGPRRDLELVLHLDGWHGEPAAAGSVR